jgi:hypothetical protein
MGVTPNASPWVQYDNHGATRNDPLSDDLVRSLSFLADMGITARVFSGGQEAAGEGGARTGSVRHDHGGAGDVFFYRNGRKLDWANPEDLPVFEEIVRRGKAAGITGFGAGEGYMQPGSMHIGFGAPAVWGAGGSGENAPDWLRAAYGAPSAAHPPGNALASSTQQPPATQTALERFQPQPTTLDARAFQRQPVNALSLVPFSAERRNILARYT